ncbi:CG0192-related protein [Aestuariimicrobium soli]|uniref:CG0192-related protein n=1 Tax=Aestuariimicrobium soli TaxID=2035834 RepID=UPI003EBF7515
MSGTAELHRATLTPTKAELLAEWLPRQPWFSSDGGDLELLDAFRFTDPDGEVGIETHLVRAGGVIHHVPVTYRGAPLEGAEEWLIGTMDHSALGQRWVYDATGDPVYQVELMRVIREGDTQAALRVGDEPLPDKATALGSWVDPTAESSGVVRIARNIDDFSTARARGLLTVTFTVDGEQRDAVVAVLR